ncbi:bone marrow stromal antigen 2-like [Bubalus kerabau]|uniref:bone marrow stromal antigen 2-like n=1 Tax=Bubalus carabanensis TaxID=3119969 RepID=UPI00244EFC3D|nr:bone marrow stromal antigen 2-like [Bubalus carabanensis]
MHYRPVSTDTEEDMNEFVMPIDKDKPLCGRKLPLWVGVLLLLVVVGLLVPMIYFTVMANSKACVDGLQAQKECQEVNQHVQRQLNQTQEFSHKKEAEAATCNHTMVTLRESLKKEQAQVAEFQGKLKILNQNLKDALAEVERLRRQSETCSKNNASSCSSFLFVVIAVLVLNALLT